MIINSIFVAIAMVLLAAGSAVSQEVPKGTTIRPGGEKIVPFDSLYRAKSSGQQLDRLEMARRLIAQGSWISAAGTLESIYAEQPGNIAVVDLLLSCYIELKAYNKAEMLIDRRLENSPDEFGLHDRKLRLYIRMGNDSLVTAEAYDILDRFAGEKYAYEAVIRTLKDNGYDDLGMTFVDRARRELNDPNLFLLEAGSFYEVRREYGKAVRQFYRAAQVDSIMAVEADKKMGALIRYPDAPHEIIDTLGAIIEANPNDTFALKFLSEAYTRQEMYPEAFESMIRLDSISEGDGRQLYNYMRRCRERRLWEQVVEVSKYLDRTDRERKIPYNYVFYYAEALRGLGQNHDAIAVYDRIFAESPSNRDRVEALMETGNVYRYNLKDYDSARVYYDSTRTAFGFNRMTLLAELENASLSMVEGKLANAKSKYEQLQGQKLLGPNQEMIAYNLALIDLFSKNYVDADLRLRKLISDYPRGSYINDAIVTSLMIRESAENYPDAIDEFADALYYEYRLMNDSAEYYLKKVIAHGYTPLLGSSMYRLAGYYTADGDIETALSLIDEMEKEYSDDYFYPYCLKLKGDILLSRTDSETEGIKIFEKILREYGGYPFVGEIREKLQKRTGARGPG